MSGLKQAAYVPGGGSLTSLLGAKSPPLSRFRENGIMAAEVREMPGTQTVEQVQIDSAIKERVMPLFSELGLDMSEAVNIFLHQCLLHGGLPFSVELPHFSAETLEAMAEARRISRDPSVKSYASVEELKKALDE